MKSNLFWISCSSLCFEVLKKFGSIFNQVKNPLAPWCFMLLGDLLRLKNYKNMTGGTIERWERCYVVANGNRFFYFVTHPTHPSAKYQLDDNIGYKQQFLWPTCCTLRPPCSHCRNITWWSPLDRSPLPGSCFHEIWERSVTGKREGKSTKGLLTALKTAINVVPVMCFYLSVQLQEYGQRLRWMRQQGDSMRERGRGSSGYTLCTLCVHWKGLIPSNAKLILNKLP